MSGAGVDCVLEAVSAPLVFGRRVGCAVLRLPTESQVFGLLDWRRSAEARSPSSWSFAAAHASAALRVVTHAEQRDGWATLREPRRGRRRLPELEARQGARGARATER